MVCITSTLVFYYKVTQFCSDSWRELTLPGPEILKLLINVISHGEFILKCEHSLANILQVIARKHLEMLSRFTNDMPCKAATSIGICFFLNFSLFWL